MFIMEWALTSILGKHYRVDMGVIHFDVLKVVPWLGGPLGCGNGVNLIVFFFALDVCLFTSFPSFDSGTMAWWWAPGW